MALQVYSTLTRKKEPFHKKPGEPVTMYVCGPTVYKPSHIGHMVGPVIFDTVKRYLTYLGYPVKWVVNITDVDDKLIVRAKELNTTVPALAEKMTADYFDCLKKLNVTGIDQFPKATEHIAGMIGMISTLIEKGYAYPAGGDVYFDVSKDKDYGKLCNRDPEQLEAGSRIEVSDKKRNPGDFALWKGAKPGEPAEVQFDSPWGKGRPGWHIECSAMSRALLGDTLDIHGGGLDLQFPHHENELAQSESTTDAPFAKVWMHNGLLKLKNKDGKDDKMAGSIGNVLNVADALKHVSGQVLRFFTLGTHYRSPIDLGIWDWNNPATPIPEGLIAAKKGYETFVRFAERYQRVTSRTFESLPTPTTLAEDRKSELYLNEHIPTTYREYYIRFRQAMDDDFNTGGAVGVLFELVTTLNKLADVNRLEEPPSRVKSDPRHLAGSDFEDGARLLRVLGSLLGLTFATGENNIGGGDQLVSGLMQLLLDLRANLRTTAKEAAKDNPLKKALFDQTDLIRKRLADLGVTLEDRPAGTTWRVG
jgi:cysteinyl-tRNA synthetase